MLQKSLTTTHLYYGATYLLNEFANELGLAADLRQCFPETYKQLLSVAFYLILEDNNTLYRFEKWLTESLQEIYQIQKR